MLDHDDLGARLRTRLLDEVAPLTAAPDMVTVLRRRARRRRDRRHGVGAGRDRWTTVARQRTARVRR